MSAGYYKKNAVTKPQTYTHIIPILCNTREIQKKKKNESPAKTLLETWMCVYVYMYWKWREQVRESRRIEKKIQRNQIEIQTRKNKNGTMKVRREKKRMVNEWCVFFPKHHHHHHHHHHQHHHHHIYKNIAFIRWKIYVASIEYNTPSAH